MLRAKGHDPLPLLNTLGLDYSQLEKESDGRIPITTMTRFLQSVEQQTGDAGFCLDVARHLQQENRSLRHCLTEISMRLGFSDSANFSKAFQRWFSMTPGQYRSLHKNKNPE